MAAHSAVVAALRVLTATPSPELPVKDRKGFETILLSNLYTLGVALREDPQFKILRGVLEKSNSEILDAVITQKIIPSGLKEPEDCNSDESEQTENRIEGKEDTSNYHTRWKFVQTCLTLLRALQESLILTAQTTAKDRPKEDQKSKKRSKEAPPLAQDSLSVNDQKIATRVIQFVVSLGICPNLLAGVGVPLARRSGFAHFIKIDEGMRKNERHLFHCVDNLVSCIQQPTLGSLILSRHLGDILAGLLQICYAPLSSYLKQGTACKTVTNNGTTRDIQIESSTSNCTCKDMTDSANDTTASLGNGRNAAIVEPVSQSEPQIVSPADIQHSHTAINEHSTTLLDKDPLFITSSERDRCSEILHRLLDRVYQPIVVRELLILQGGTASSRQNPMEAKQKCPSTSPQMTVDERKGEKAKSKKLITPKWLRDVCGNLLSERLMKPHGVRGILHGILEADRGNSPDWHKCDVVAKLIANCPSQASSVEEYYRQVAPQVLDLLHVSSTGLGRQFLRVAASTIQEMLQRYPKLGQDFVLKPVIRPLERTINSQDKLDGHCEIVADEGVVIRCVEDLHKIFVCGPTPCLAVLQCLSTIIHPLFELFCFTRKGVSHLRSSVQELLVHFLKHLNPRAALKTLYILAFKEAAPREFGTQKNDQEKCGKQDDTSANIVIELMKPSYKFVHGDSGGVVITHTGARVSGFADDVLGSLRGEVTNECEIHALCLVELLSDVKRDGLAAEFFLHLMQQLTGVVADDSSHITQTASSSRTYLESEQAATNQDRSLLIVHVVALMCEKMGPSILQSTRHTLAFVKSTLHRACVICRVDGDVASDPFVTETLTMALGILSALLGGAVKVELGDWQLLQDFVPMLDTLSERHPVAEVQDMANDLRIAIATHNAVWSQRMKEAAEDLTGVKPSLSAKSASSRAGDEEFDEALSQLCDPFLPTRGHALMSLAKLLQRKSSKALKNAETLLKIFQEQLAHDDSYIYLASIQGLVALAAVKPDVVIPQLAREFACCRENAQASEAEAEAKVKEQGLYVPTKTDESKDKKSKSVEVRIKLGEALVRATRTCGEMVPRYSRFLVPALLSGVRDSEHLVRASSLSNLGDVCKLLRFSVGPIVHEVFCCLSAVLRTDKSSEVRRAAVLVVTLLLKGLGKDTLQVLSSSLKEIYHLLKIIESTDSDEVTRLHAQAALAELDSIMREFLFPKQSFTKQIQVLR